jgi:CTP synthase
MPRKKVKKQQEQKVPRKTKRILKYVFVVGGVMSGVGKGIASASIGKILQARGYEVTAIKIDPYVNVDAGTMNPTEHGEVFVLDDGTECDQDMGNYERFLDRNLPGTNYMTTGSMYLSIITKERNLAYEGKCVSVVPHVPLEVINKINTAARKSKADIVITEIGGTVGEYQNILFLEAVRMLKVKKPDDVLLVLVSYLPQRGDDNEPKTKPTQYAVRTLNSAGLQPDMVIARAERSLDKKRKEKIAFNCNVNKLDVISGPDVHNIYEIPVNLEKEKISDRLLKKLNLPERSRDLKEWRALARRVDRLTKTVKIGIVGKYFTSGDFVLSDSYISVIESIKHAAYAEKHKPEIVWIDAVDFDPETPGYRENLKRLKELDGIIVPGGFGGRAIEGKINAINYCRRERIPYFGLCYGMQLAVVEFARNVAKLRNANTTEINLKTPHPVIDILPEQIKNVAEKKYGATMRLGAYEAILKPDTIAYSAYASHPKSKNYKLKAISYKLISERHRHRYEVNPKYISRLEKKGLVFSGQSPDRRLMEIAELPREVHPFFVGSQFHPEFTSRPLSPNPLFLEFIKAAISKLEKK